MTTTKNIIPTDLEDLVKAFDEMHKKYMDLVWYARSQSHEQMESSGTPEHIITGALNAQARKEELYPDEIDEMRSETSNWEHGFNSGCLATMRFVITTMASYEFPDEESDDPESTITMGGLQEAKDEFPMLDT